MKDKNFPGIIIALLFMAFMCGGLAMFNTSEIARPKPSIETINSIARAESAAQIARDNESAANNEKVKMLMLAVATIVVAVLVLPMSFMLSARGVSHWHRRHDRLPDHAGNYALVCDGTPMWNPNTGMMVGAAVSEATMLALAAQRAQVHQVQAAFSGGIERGQARSYQRRIGESEPEGWNVATPQPEQAAQPAPEFLLVDDKGERKMIESEANAWQSK